jgi:cobalt-zinc-cadmium resistance protein CzcA
MFLPMGLTISFALVGSLLFSILSIPALSFYLVKKNVPAAKDSFLMEKIQNLFLPFFSFCRKHKKRVLLTTLLIFLSGLSLIPFMGREYIPYLEEGTLHLRATYDPNISLQETINLTTLIEKELKNIPEVRGVLSRIGRGEVGSHAHFVNDAEILINYTPVQKWKRLRNKDQFLEEIEHRLEKFPGVTLNMTQPIAHNLDEMVTGVKAQLALKVFGHDFDILLEISQQVKDILGEIRGAANVQVEQFTGQNHIQILIDRNMIARYGVNISDIQETIEAAFGGITLGQVYEEQKKFDIFLRFEEKFRKDIPQLENLLIRLPGGGRIPLAQLASIEEIIGPRVVSREGNKRFITVMCNIRGRDIGRFVAEAKKEISKRISLPAEYFLRWGGQFELQKRANQRLAIITPITLALVILLLFSVFKSKWEVFIILINIPLALTGGILALKLTGLYLSVPASIGFIAIFGIALEDGLVLLSAFHSQLKKGRDLQEAVFMGVKTKLRPVLMTTFTTIFGILPLLLAQGPGAEIQRPLATVVIGGLITSTLVTLIVMPLFFELLKKNQVANIEN